MPDGAFSQSDGDDVAYVSDVNELQPVEDYNAEVDGPSTLSEFDDDADGQQFVEQGFEVFRRERVEGNQGGGSLGRRCALRALATQFDPRRDCDGSSPS